MNSKDVGISLNTWTWEQGSADNHVGSEPHSSSKSFQSMCITEDSSTRHAAMCITEDSSTRHPADAHPNARRCLAPQSPHLGRGIRSRGLEFRDCPITKCWTDTAFNSSTIGMGLLPAQHFHEFVKVFIIMVMLHVKQTIPKKIYIYNMYNLIVDKIYFDQIFWHCIWKMKNTVLTKRPYSAEMQSHFKNAWFFV